MNQGKKQNRWRRLLRKAANLLKKSGWCRALRASDNAGHSCPVFDENAVNFCLVGALNRAHGSHVQNAYAGEPLNTLLSKDPENKAYYEACMKIRENPIFANAVNTRYVLDDIKPLWAFNDRFANSKEDVIKLLETTAEMD